MNLKPLVPGHVLIIPKRKVATILELTEEEHLDLWTTSLTVETVLQAHYGKPGANFGVQDGKDAGQSMPHVHIHVLPL